MQKALNGSDPVVFFESQRIYDVGEMFHEGGVPSEAYEMEIGAVNRIRSGSDLTILTIGATLYMALKAAEKLEETYGVKAEIINLPSITPLDYGEIVESVKKTGKVLLVSDACMRGSILNDIAQHITELCFDYLDAPPVVVGARNWITPPYEFEEDFFPQPEWLIDAIASDILPLGDHHNQTAPTKTEKIRRAKFGV
jgi:2-oxoisovalerate dehydrogenase E1 component